MPKITPPAAGELAGIDTWIFDLDNTLYPARTRLFDQIDQRIGEFIQRQFGVGHGEAKRLQKSYFQRHGTTLRGLMLEHGIAPEGFLAYVHDIDFSILEPAERIDRALQRLDGRKLIFTNADVPYAERVMERLGVRHHFEEIYDIAAAAYVPKPLPEAYATLIERHAVVPERSIFFEDIVRNLAPAAELGMTTVWVRHDDVWSSWGAEEVDCHYATDDLAGWLEVLADGHGSPRPGD
ncbi:MAG: pyrimidine 5'-nucleotidase [Alphaproteobacteria bacterium]